MKNFFLSCMIAMCFIMFVSITQGQTTIYTTNFGTTSGTFPSGWTKTSTGTGTWIITSTSASSTYAGASASMNATATNGTTGTSALICNPGISTIGYSNITVLWGARATSTFINAVTFEWSVDGTTWNTVSFTEVTANSVWALANGGVRIALPVGAEGAANLQFRRVYTAITGSGTYRMDDFDVQGTISGPSIILNTTSFSGAFGYTKVGNSSTSSSFSVSGNSLTGNILLTPPIGFEIRTGANAFSTSAITLTQAGGTVVSTTVDVRCTPLAYIKYAGSISCATTGGGTQNIPISGTGGIKSVAAGNWSSGTTWDGGVVPTSAQNVYINASFPVVVDNGLAECNTIDFDPVGTAGLLSMGAANSVLSIYGDFNLGNATQMVFSTSWPAGAKVKFTGTAPIQYLTGFNTSTVNSGGIMEMQVDKSAGKLTTTGLNMKLTIGTSLEIVNGIFEMAATDDIFGRDFSGTATTPTITVQVGGIFTIAAGATQINQGTSGASGPIGKMTVYGLAELTTTSSAKLNFGGIDVESGGTLRLLLGWTALYFNSGAINVKSGGTLRNGTTTNVWDPTASVVMASGSSFNVTSSGTIALPVSFTDNGATWKYSLAAAQSGILARTYENLELSGGVSKSPLGNVIVNGLLSLKDSAILNLGAFNLTTNSVSGGRDSSFVNTNGAGLFTIKNVGNGTSTSFPVGNGIYAPVKITNSGATDDFSVLVSAGTPCNAAADKSVNRIWTITEAIAGGSNAAITLQWSPATETANFNRNNAAAVHCSGGVIDQIGAAGPATMVDTFYSKTISAVSNFSPFGVTSDMAILPVTGISLTAVRNSKSTDLFWKTETEINSRYFDIQRSIDGQSFKTISTSNASGNSVGIKKYQYQDMTDLFTTHFYRIKIIDEDGKYGYSPVVLVKAIPAKFMSVLSNPVMNGEISMILNPSFTAGLYTISIVDHAGRLVSIEKRNIQATDQKIVFKTRALPGAYFLRIQNERNSMQEKIMIVR